MPLPLLQSAKPAPRTGNQNLDPALHPLWAAGITGRGQVIGCGDSGLGEHCCAREGCLSRPAAVLAGLLPGRVLPSPQCCAALTMPTRQTSAPLYRAPLPPPSDAGHCFFSDPAFTELAFGVQDGLLTFDSPDHRKIRWAPGRAGVGGWMCMAGGVVGLMPRSAAEHLRERLLTLQAPLTSTTAHTPPHMIHPGLSSPTPPHPTACSYYRAQSGDVADANGHGTHVVGTLLGLPAGYGLSDAEGAGEAGANIGMAPDAKVAFTGALRWSAVGTGLGWAGGGAVDAAGCWIGPGWAWREGRRAVSRACCLARRAPSPAQPQPLPHACAADLGGGGSGNVIYTPSDLANSYFPYTYGAGAAIHSGACAGRSCRAWAGLGRVAWQGRGAGPAVGAAGGSRVRPGRCTHPAPPAHSNLPSCLHTQTLSTCRRLLGL